MKKDIRILLVDDHQVVREGLRHMLELETDMEVVGEAADAKEALTQVKLLSPKVILMDIKMPGVDGIELTRQLKEKQLPCNIIMLTLYDEYLTEAIEAGAAGYLLKDIKREELAQAIRQVHSGEVVISGSITDRPQTESEEGFSEKAVDSGPMLEEVQIVIPLSVGANQLLSFINRVEEVLKSNTRQMVSSWKGGAAFTVALPWPIPLASVLHKLGEMSEVEAMEEKPLTEESAPSLFKKAVAMPRVRPKPSRAIFVTLKNDARR